MDNISAFIQGQANRDKEQMVFDWEKAAKLICENKAKYAEAGLEGDWEWTGGPIWKNGKPVPENDTSVYLSSTWATPQLMIDGKIIDCYKMASKTPGWNSDTYWPPEAMKIIQSKK